MTSRSLVLLCGGVVFGCLVGMAVTVGVLYHRPGSAAVRKVGLILGIGGKADWAGPQGASRRREANTPMVVIPTAT